jgi:uncharacterized protein with PQ loop repeat
MANSKRRLRVANNTKVLIEVEVEHMQTIRAKLMKKVSPAAVITKAISFFCCLIQN